MALRTDGGSEHPAATFQAACPRPGIAQSMGRLGSALDNAMIGSWHSTHVRTRAHARHPVAERIDEYKRDRKHSMPGMRAPITFELDHTVPAAPSVPPYIQWLKSLASAGPLNSGPWRQVAGRR